MNPIPVLMYHHVNLHKGDMFTVTPEVFEGQMAYIAKAGYKALTLDELLAFIRGDLDLRQKAVAITFDDVVLSIFIHTQRVTWTAIICPNRISWRSWENPREFWKNV